MVNKILSIFAITIVLIVVVISAYYVFEDKSSSNEKYHSNGTHRPLFWEESSFYDAILNASQKQVSNYIVQGAIIPHHLLASDIIAEFFQTIQEQPVERIVLIGPNHYELGRTNIITSYYDWNTPIGTVRSDLAFIELILKQASFAGVDEDVAEREHSVSSIMPFIAHYFPSAKVVPIIVSTKITSSQLSALSKILFSLNNQGTLFLASVDFSHHLTSDQAEVRDVTTLNLLRDGNLDSFLTVDSTYTDSPKSIVLLFKIMKEAGLSDFHVLSHENSGLRTNNKFGEVTSYFSIVFNK